MFAGRFLPPKLSSWAAALDVAGLAFVLDLAGSHSADHNRKADSIGWALISAWPLFSPRGPLGIAVCLEPLISLERHVRDDFSIVGSIIRRENVQDMRVRIVRRHSPGFDPATR